MTKEQLYDKAFNLFRYGGIGKANYDRVKGLVAESNRKSLMLFSSIAAGLVFIMWLLSFIIPELESSRGTYIVCVLASFALLLAAYGPGKNSRPCLLISMYIFEAMLLIAGIVLGTVVNPHQASVSFAVLMFAAPLLFTDIPARVNAVTFIGITAYLISAKHTQDISMYKFNESVVIPYGVIGIMIDTFLLRMKFNGFMLQDKTTMLEEIKGLNDRLVSQDKAIEDAGMGIWKIMIQDGMEPRMYANNTMKKLLGIEGREMTQEEIYKAWYDNIDNAAIDSVNNSVRKMAANGRDENTYKWNHPILGERYVRCGGVYTPIKNGQIYSGYHYDVTDQVKNDHRKQYIIDSLAYSYDFLAYVRTEDWTFNVFLNKLHYEKDFFDALNLTDARDVLKYFCENRIDAEYKQRLIQFTDLSTIGQRLAKSPTVSIEYRNIYGIWFSMSFIAADRNPDGTPKHIVCALREIDEEKQEELKKQRLIDETVAANRAKTKFLQNMSHEIRTPLNAMFGFAQLLGMPDGSWTDAEKDQYSRYIYNSYNMLDMLIGDILDIADSQHDNYRISKTVVKVNDVCNDAMSAVEYRVPEGIKYYFTSDLADNYVVMSDGRRIQQVLINYLTNACKHTKAGEIHLHCSTSEVPGMLAFSVTDTGEGVPAEKADLIFKRYIKLEDNTEGSGLGLNICMLVSEKLGGKVYLDKSYTGGARFVFTIPANDNLSA